jgi:hypothetical protein
VGVVGAVDPLAVGEEGRGARRRPARLPHLATGRACPRCSGCGDGRGRGRAAVGQEGLGRGAGAGWIPCLAPPPGGVVAVGQGVGVVWANSGRSEGGELSK